MRVELRQRAIELEGCGNFRDLGGYRTANGRRTRWRTLFRSDSLHWLTAADFETLAGYGVRLHTALDLRTPKELDRTGTGLLRERGVRHLHAPFMPVLDEMQPPPADGSPNIPLHALATGALKVERYMDLFRQAGPSFQHVFHTLSNRANYPAAIYCMAGKDRTGMATAILLRALGVPEEQIMEDYSLTPIPSPERIKLRRKAFGFEPRPDFNFDPSLFEARPETMALFLEAFDAEYGSVEAYLSSIGVHACTIEAVADRLLED
jgi:protein-tyrosine phosphatase